MLCEIMNVVFNRLDSVFYFMGIKFGNEVVVKCGGIVCEKW